jgi:membrane peptidoglycan carboxypeptidase
MAVNPKKGLSNQPRRPKKANQVTTKSGNTIKLHRSLSDRIKARRDAKAARRAEYLKDLPKSRVKRFFYRLQPKRLYKYWFSREGAIMALKIIGIGIVVVFITLIGVFAYFRKDLPNLKDISGNNLGGSIRYYDRTGQTLLWEDYDAVKRIPVQSDQMNNYMKEATVAIEDKDFYKHGGFDVKGIARAGFNDFFKHGSTQGGSTITQQLVKLTQDWTKDRSYTRKIKELILSVELERSYSKDDILTGYLNAAPYGNVEYGVEAASRDYFQKSAKDLTLDEAAFLASIPKSPSFYSPYGPYFDTKLLKSRSDYVLDVMQQTGKITAAQRDAAKKVDVVAKIHPQQNRYAGIKAPYFVLGAKQELENSDQFKGQTYKKGGWKVTTTLDLNLQNMAEQQVSKGLAQIKRQGGDTAAFAAEDVTTGQMVAVVGGVDFSNPNFGQFNYAQTLLPPGSSFKPYDYTALLESTNNFGAGSVLFDTQGPLDGYPCTNKAVPKAGGNCLWDYDLVYPGPITLRYALGGSRNVPAVKAMLTTGVDRTIQIADKLMGNPEGYKCFRPNLEDISKATTSDERSCYASSAIGDGAYLHLDDHINGYASISRNGMYLPKTYILKVDFSTGKPAYEWKASKGTQVVRPDAAYIVADMMSDPNASYFPANRKPHRFNTAGGTWKFAMKTGTTNDGKDGWMMGFSTKYAAGVWVGYHNRQVVMTGSMENMTQPIWQGWMDAAHTNLTPVDRVKPSDVQTLPAYVVRNHVGIGSVEPSPSTDLFPSWFQSKKINNGQKQVIDVVSNKLATECTPEKAKKEITNADANAFSGDTFVNNGGANTSAQDDVHKCDDIKPTITGLNVTPSGAPGSYSFSAQVTGGTHPLSSDQFKGTVNFIVDGQIVQSVQVDADGAATASNWHSTLSGDHSVTAQVIDSVLYDSTTDAEDVTFQTYQASSPLTITDPTAGKSVGTSTYNAKWTGGSGLYSVKLNGSPVATCTNISTTQCTLTLLGPTGTSYLLSVSTSSETQSVTFKK